MNLKDFFDSIGLNGTKWQWRIFRFRERWRNTLSDAGTRATNATYSHRICQNCGSLIDAATKVCPRCGAKLLHWRIAQIQRAFRMFLPGGVTGVSLTLIAANIAAMLAVMICFGASNLISPSTFALVRSGALVPVLVTHGDWWRIITYAFLHGGFLHIAFNMSSLTQVGPISEREIGSSRFWVLYFLAAVGGAAADFFWNAHFGTRPLVIGASGAIFGLIGFGLTFNHFYGGSAGRSNARIYLQWAVYSFAFGFIMPAVDNVCHAGGFLTGALLGFIYERDLRHGGKLAMLWRALAMVFTVATIAAIVHAIRGGVPFQ